MFEATHHHKVTGEKVRVTVWAKDGDHPAVVRYPIEKRDWKGLLVTGKKEKFALRFGDCVLEDSHGRMWVAPLSQVNADYVKE